MAASTWLLVAIGVLIILLAYVAYLARKGRKQPTDYYGIFLGGIVWLLFGIAMQSAIFLAGGAILLLIGLAHKDEWEKSRMAKEGKNAKYALAAGFIVAFILAISFFYLGSKSPEEKAKIFCGKENVATARVCDGYIEVVSALLGGGSTYYSEGNTMFSCHVVGADSISPECRRIFEAKLNSSMSCRDVCANIMDFESCAASGYPVMESYPRQCMANGVTYVEEISEFIECTPEQRNVDACTKEYRPVCAKVNIQCIRAPCNPISETFSNACEACKNPLVESYVMGACK